ncbi:MAG: fused MFS/spermidine synthase [Akkermansiaceae bacterium]|nr:fused MFS/spermidine synthase [Akkermansiaceae bacterium]
MSAGKSGKRWKQKEQPAKDRRLGLPSLSALVLISGFASLVYQVLWMRHLGLLFGSGPQAAAATFAMFFAGLGVGSWWWGRKVSGKPLRLYALLELGIAASAVAYFGLRWLMALVYPSIYGALVGSPWLLIAKLVMAGLLIFPAAFFMGGTIPAMAQGAVKERSRFGSTSAWLYATNTLGATLGVVLGAFLLLPAFGLRMSYGIALLCSLLAALWAWWGSRVEDETMAPSPEEKDEATGRLDIRVALLAFVSGFVVLGLEVVWTRIFSQVHENSVYAFAVILAVVLLGLAIGAAISSLLARMNQPPRKVLLVVLLVSGGLIVLGPAMLLAATRDLQPLSNPRETWSGHVADLFRMGFGGVGFTVIALGVVFPFLMKMAEHEVKVPGRMLGRLLAINTLGAILGSLACGFVLLPMLGMWSTLQFMAVLHLAAALLLTLGWGRALLLRVNLLILIGLTYPLFHHVKLPVLAEPQDVQNLAEVLEVWEGSDCTVAVVKKKSGHRAILVNATYSLGSTGAYTEQVNQTRIPLYLYPETQSICYIGVGTGMSVGAALDEERFPNVERVLACELSPSVIEAARKWMPSHLLGGLFEDERVEILAVDGRHHLMASKERFDMINADLFLPYRRGAGSLYSLDHYEVVAQRLKEDGVFVQWLPMYQLTEYEFGVIVHTALQVFGEVTMWRNNFDPGHEKVALICKVRPSPVPVPPAADLKEMRTELRGLDWQYFSSEGIKVKAEFTPFFYAGNLAGARELFESYPLNTDDHPVIEFQTPWRFREVAQKDEVIWCVGPKLLGWMERVFDKVPPESDPHLTGHGPFSWHLVRSGMAFHEAMVAKILGKWEQTDQFWDAFKREWIRAATPE